MNPRQRRGALLLLLAVLGAAGVYFLMSRYLGDVQDQLGPQVPVVGAAQDLPPFATPDEEDLAVEMVPQRWVGPNTITDPAQIGSRVTSAPIPQGSVLSAGMFLDRPAIGPNEREIAILVDAVTGVGGKLTSGSVVDVIATFPQSETERASARIVLQRAEIISVGSPVDVPEEGAAPSSVGFGASQQLPVTFRLSVHDSRVLAYTEAFASSIRLALRAPGDDAVLPGDDAIFEPEIEDLGREISPVGPNPTEPPPIPDPPGDDAGEDEGAGENEGTGGDEGTGEDEQDG